MRKVIAATFFLALSGCVPTGGQRPKEPAPIPRPTFSQYHLENFSWDCVARVLVLPLLNESDYTRAPDEIARALRTELQTLGRFEVVAAPTDDLALMATDIHRAGRFNEATMLAMARDTKADVVIHGTITAYSPYPRPRLGLVLQAVGPNEAKVVSSVDGVWDSTRWDVAERIRKYYRMDPHQHPWINNHDINEDDSYSGEMALDSPQLFQRFVCAEAMLNLVKDCPKPVPMPPPACKSGYIERPDLARTKKNMMPGW